MSSGNGYVKATRDRFSNPLFANEVFCKISAWDWLVAHAAWKECRVDVAGKLITLERGQLCYSLRYIATAWNWTAPKVKRFLTRLKTDTMIDTDIVTGMTRITICNYEKYQGDAAKPIQETLQQTLQHRYSTVTNKKKDKQDKKNIYTSDFEDWWQVYPRKINKKPAFYSYRSAMKKIDASHLIAATKKFAQSVSDTEERFIPHPSTFLNQERWDDFPAPIEPRDLREWFHHRRDSVQQGIRDACASYGLNGGEWKASDVVQAIRASDMDYLRPLADDLEARHFDNVVSMPRKSAPV